VCVCVHVRVCQLLNQGFLFCETSYEHDGVGAHSIALFVNFLHAVITVWWLCKHVSGKKLYITSHILLHELCFGKPHHSEKSQISAFWKETGETHVDSSYPIQRNPTFSCNDLSKVQGRHKLLSTDIFLQACL
jgi:hypothetical protein